MDIDKQKIITMYEIITQDTPEMRTLLKGTEYLETLVSRGLNKLVKVYIKQNPKSQEMPVKQERLASISSVYSVVYGLLNAGVSPASIVAEIIRLGNDRPGAVPEGVPSNALMDSYGDYDGLRGLLHQIYPKAYYKKHDPKRLVIPTKLEPELLKTDLLTNLTVDNLTDILLEESPLIVFFEKGLSCTIDYSEFYTEKEGVVRSLVIILFYYKEGIIADLTDFMITISPDDISLYLVHWFENEMLRDFDDSETRDYDPEMGTKVKNAITAALNSSLITSCSNIKIKDEVYIKKPTNSAERRAIKKFHKKRLPMYKFINIGNVSFLPTDKKEKDLDKPKGKSPRPHMRVGHFRSQRFKTDRGEWRSKIIFIAPVAVLGGSTQETKVFQVLDV